MTTTEKMYDVYTEESVLSSIIFNNDVYYESELIADLFTNQRKPLFEEIKIQMEKGNDVDIVSLFPCEIMSGTELSALIDTPISINISNSVDRLKNCHLLRNMYKKYGNAINMCLSGSNPYDISRECNVDMSGLESNSFKSLNGLSDEALAEIKKDAKEGINKGLKSGIQALDFKTGGFLGNEFVIIAARPGNGKTSLMLNIARNFAYTHNPGIIFSLEMSAVQLTKRMYCDVGSIESNMLFQNKIADKKNKHVWGEIEQAETFVKTMPIFVDDSVNLNIDQIYVRAKKARLIHGIKWIAIDYIGLIDGWTKEGQAPKADITRKIKLMAKDLDVPVIALAQLNRDIENRNIKSPKMSDLRDAGSLEQDCDIALFPSFYDDHESTGFTHDSALIHIVKNRKGQTGVIKDLKWEGQYFRYSDKRR